MGKITDYSPFFSRRSSRRQPSVIRILNKLQRAEGVISLGGGNPNHDTFPFESVSVRLKDGSVVELDNSKLYEGLEYAPSPGVPSFVAWLKQHQTRVHAPPTHSDWDVLVTSGSQEGINIAFDMLLNEGDSVLLELPAYSGALSALLPYGCNLVGIETDEKGLIPQRLEDKLANWDASHPFPKVLYTVPTGQNPAGCTISLERKHKIYEIACKYNLIILEDDPYYFLSFTDEPIKSYFSFDVEGRVLRFDSFSKILAGGIRVGWATGPAALIHRMELHMQAVCIHSSALSQVIAYRVVESWGPTGFDAHVRKVQEFYKNRRDTFLELLDKHLKGLAEWTVPVAGMFVWIKLLNVTDSMSLIMEKAVAKKVLLVPGQSFHPNNEISPYVRASYSTASKDQMEEALRRLVALLTDK